MTSPACRTGAGSTSPTRPSTGTWAPGSGHRAALRCVDEDGGVVTTTYEQLAARDQPLRQRAGDLGVERATGWSPCSAGSRSCTSPRSARSSAARSSRRCSPPSGPSRSGSGCGSAGPGCWSPPPSSTGARWRRCGTDLPHLEHVLVVGEPPDRAHAEPDRRDGARLRRLRDRADQPRGPGAAALHQRHDRHGPKGAVHVHEAVVAHHATAEFALDLRPGDVFWCTADPGWVTGTSYGIIAPLTHGATVVSDAGEFDARRVVPHPRVAEQVTVWYTAPTALRMLMRHGAGLGAGPRPLGAAARRQRRRAAQPRGRDLGDATPSAGPSTTTGGRPRPARSWSATTRAWRSGRARWGAPMPGVEAAVLVRGEDGRARVVDGQVTVAGAGRDRRAGAAARAGRRCSAATSTTRSATAPASPTGGTSAATSPGVDADGYFWFVGRADDVIKSAGHLIGPFEVESALMEHPAVVEAGVIGKPDPVAGELVKAFVTLRARLRADDGPAPGPAGVRPAPARRPRAQGDRLRPAPAAHPQRQGDAPAAQGPRARAARGGHLDAGERPVSAKHRQELLRTMLPHPALRGGAASSSTAPPGSAASCTSTSARRRSPPG